MYCKNCGNIINANERFCGKCGTPVEVIQQPQVVENKFGKIYLLTIGLGFIWFSILTVIILALGSQNAPKILKDLQVGVPIYSIVIGWIPILATVKTKGKTEKLNKFVVASFPIILVVVLTLLGII